MKNIILNRRINFTIITSIIFLIFTTLGTWQIYRLKWKLNIIQQIKIQLSMNALDNKDLVLNDSKLLKYRKIKIYGKFLHKNEIYLYAGNMTPNGKPGYFILTPFEYAVNQFILVNRGFLTTTQKVPNKSRPDNTNNQIQTIEGILIPETYKPYFVPNNETKNNLWFWINLSEISNYLNMPLYDTIILQYNHHDNTLITNAFSLQSIRNDHLFYAITWYSIALAVFILYLRYKNNF
ncbi:MAG: SURF1 family protein [Rickettsiales endosymbiont of Dermacentor nuttalli]